MWLKIFLILIVFISRNSFARVCTAVCSPCVWQSLFRTWRDGMQAAHTRHSAQWSKWQEKKIKSKWWSWRRRRNMLHECEYFASFAISILHFNSLLEAFSHRLQAIVCNAFHLVRSIIFNAVKSTMNQRQPILRIWYLNCPLCYLIFSRKTIETFLVPNDNNRREMELWNFDGVW